MPALWSLTLSVGLFTSSPLVAPDQQDDFEDGTTQGWTEGNPTPNPPVNVPDGGPAGAGDAFLRNVSAGGSGPGSAMVTYNVSQWTGDYVSAGVRSIEADLANFGAEPLHMRVAVQGAGGTQYGSTDAVELPADGLWHHVAFDLARMSVIAGPEPLDDVLAEVVALRVLSAAAGPDWQGDRIAGTLGIDNVTAHPAPDADADGVPDDADNCTLAANVDQRDTNGDGYGNVCDADLDDNGAVNFLDVGLMKSVFFATGDLDADLDGDGVVSFGDLGLLQAAIFGPPGPSGVLP